MSSSQFQPENIFVPTVFFFEMFVLSISCCAVVVLRTSYIFLPEFTNSKNKKLIIFQLFKIQFFNFSMILNMLITIDLTFFLKPKVACLKS